MANHLASRATWELHSSRDETPLIPVPGGCSSSSSSSTDTPIDTGYHGYYTTARQADVHLPILQRLLSGHPDDAPVEPVEPVEAVEPRARPTLVLTAGAMGSGHTHVLNQWMRLYPQRFPHGLVRNDPDAIKTLLPEAAEFARQDRLGASTRLHRESCYLSERLLWETLHRGRTTILEGTLKDAAWHLELIARIRQRHPDYRVVILHVLADAAVVRARALRRCGVTGRCIPDAVLEDALRQVPHAVEVLRDVVDGVVVVDNSQDDDSNADAAKDVGAVECVSIRGLDRAEVFTLLYNNARGRVGTPLLTLLDTQRFLALKVESLQGADTTTYLTTGEEDGWPRMKLHLGTDLLLVDGYDQECGPGKAASVLLPLLRRRIAEVQRLLRPPALVAVERMFGWSLDRESAQPLPERDRDRLCRELGSLVARLHSHEPCAQHQHQHQQQAHAVSSANALPSEGAVGDTVAATAKAESSDGLLRHNVKPRPV